MKFDENARRRVVREVQRQFGVGLRKIGPARNYLIDDKGVRYIVLGGVDYRHEIPCSIFQEEELAAGDTRLVVATLDRGNLDIFIGPFQPLLEHRHQLSIDNEHYVFHLHRFASRLIVREIPSLELEQIRQEAPGNSACAARTVADNLKRANALALARGKVSKSRNEARSRADERVVAVEGNLIRADFRKKT